MSVLRNSNQGWKPPGMGRVSWVGRQAPDWSTCQALQRGGERLHTGKRQTKEDRKRERNREIKYHSKGILASIKAPLTLQRRFLCHMNKTEGRGRE